MKTLTHTGKVSTLNYGQRPATQSTVLLRETKLYWVTEDGRKFTKSGGSEVPFSMWSRQHLRLDTITEKTQ